MSTFNLFGLQSQFLLMWVLPKTGAPESSSSGWSVLEADNPQWLVVCNGFQTLNISEPICAMSKDVYNMSYGHPSHHDNPYILICIYDYWGIYNYIHLYYSVLLDWWPSPNTGTSKSWLRHASLPGGSGCLPWLLSSLPVVWWDNIQGYPRMIWNGTQFEFQTQTYIQTNWDCSAGVRQKQVRNYKCAPNRNLEQFETFWNRVQGLSGIPGRASVQKQSLPPSMQRSSHNISSTIFRGTRGLSTDSCDVDLGTNPASQLQLIEFPRISTFRKQMKINRE